MYGKKTRGISVAIRSPLIKKNRSSILKEFSEKEKAIIGPRHAFPLANSARSPYIFESRRQDHRSWREDI